MDIWDEEMMAENEEYFNASSDENETVLKNKTDTTLKMLKSGLSKNTKKVMSTLREDTKGKGGMMIQIFKEEWKNNRKSPDRPLSVSNESLPSIKDDAVNESDKESESKLKKLKSGFGKKIKDIREDIVDIRDESLHSFNELKETYQEKAEQKKAIITSFTEEEVKIFRKGSPLPPQVTKQMSSMYLSRRFSIIRFTILRAKNLDTSRLKPTDSIFVKLSLGLERFKTRQVPVSSNPTWLETNTLPRQTDEDEEIIIELFGRGSKETYNLGSSTLNIAALKADTQSYFSLDLQGDFTDSVLELVLWVTAVRPDTVEEMFPKKDDKTAKHDYILTKSLENISDVGYLNINLIEASGLGSNKLQGTLNPYCQLELDNQYHRTATAIKTKNPFWNKMFHFQVTDSFSFLKISIISEKLNSPPLLLGKAVIRLSSLHNCSGPQNMWIALKDRKLRKEAKGDSPKLHLELQYVHNPIRSAITVFKNKDDLLYEVSKAKFERATLLRNVNRIKQFLPKGSTITKMKNSYSDIIAWKNPARTVKYFIFYMFFVYYFQIWWIPVFLLFRFYKNWKNKRNKIPPEQEIIAKAEVIDDADDDDEEEMQEEKKSLKQSLDSLQNILLEFQEGCGLVASYLERLFNLCHFEEQALSLLFCFLLFILSLILYLIGLRSVLLLWGVNKFTKKLRDSDPVPTNELDNLILRVPDFDMVEDAKKLNQTST